MTLRWYKGGILYFYRTVEMLQKYSILVAILDCIKIMAGRGGFEPPEVLPSPVFKTGTFDHSDISRQFEA